MSLSSNEQIALSTLQLQLQQQWPQQIVAMWWFGSKARGDARPDSDLDVMIVVDSTDWRVHKQVRYLVADINLQFETEISACVWSQAKWQRMAATPTTFYEEVCRDGRPVPLKQMPHH